MAKKKTANEVVQEKSDRMMSAIARQVAYFRSNPHRFVKEYLNVDLKLFQKILLYAMMDNNYFFYIAARG